MKVAGSFCRHGVEEAGEEAPGGAGAEEAEGGAGEGQDEPAADHQPQHLAGAGAERHAHPDLLPPPRHRVGEEAVDPDHRQRQGEGGEGGEERAAEARLGERARQLLLHRRGGEDREVAVQLAHHLARLAGGGQRVAGGAHQDGSAPGSGTAPAAGRAPAPPRRRGP